MTTVTWAVWDEKENINCCGRTEETHTCRGLFKCPPVRYVIRVARTNQNTHKHTPLLLASYIMTARDGSLLLVNAGEGDCRHVGGWQAAGGGARGVSACGVSFF